MAAMGWMVPTSLLACMTLMAMVSGRMARRTSSGSTMPYPSTGRYVTATPRRSRACAVLSTAWCSMLDVMR
jgi:hypothetical protein